jgi:hypothetical protein
MTTFEWHFRTITMKLRVNMFRRLSLGLHARSQINDLPSYKRISQAADEFMKKLGVQDCTTGHGTRIAAITSIRESIAQADFVDADGFSHVQILGDACRSLKEVHVVNMCTRGMNALPFYNSLSCMNRL